MIQRAGGRRGRPFSFVGVAMRNARLIAGAVLVVVLSILFALLAGESCAGEAFFDWRGDIRREVGVDGFSREVWEAGKAADLYIFGGPNLFTPEGIENARALAQDDPLLATVSLLHARHPGLDLSPWPFRQAKRAVDGAIAIADDGVTPVVRWKPRGYEDETELVYHVDPYSFDARAFAEFVVEWSRDRYAVDGVMLDYISRNPWTYPDEPTWTLDEATTSVYRANQILVVYYIRQLWPEAIIIANGRWPMEQPKLTSEHLLDGVLWEQCGALWWGPERFLELFAGRPGLNVIGMLWRPSARWAEAGFDLLTTGRVAAALQPGAFVVEWGSVGPRK